MVQTTAHGAELLHHWAQNLEILFDDDPMVLCQVNPSVVSIIWPDWPMPVMVTRT